MSYKLYTFSRVKINNWFILTLLLIAMAILFTYKVDTSFRMPAGYNYDSDFGRDLVAMYTIAQGDHTLLGPQLNFSGLRMGPYHFYLFAPFFWVSGFDYRAVIYTHIGLFISALILFFVVISHRYSALIAFLSTLWLATTPYIILASRSPGNAFSYIPFLILFLSIFIFRRAKLSIPWHVFLGIIQGIIANFHPISLLTTLPVQLVHIYWKSAAVKKGILYTLSALCGLMATFLPLLLFEITHRFVITSHLFDPNRSKTAMFRSDVSLGAFFEYFNLTYQHIPVTIFGLFVLVFFFSSAMQHKYLRILGLWCGGAFLFLFVYQLGTYHYFLPTLLLLQIIVIRLTSSVKKAVLIFLVLIAINVTAFPTHLYQPARNLASIEKSVDEYLLQTNLPKKGLNIVLYNETPLSKVGYEYRYLFLKKGFKIDHEQEYAQSPYLLSIVEHGTHDTEADNSWEIAQFGRKQLIHTKRVESTTFSLFQKDI